MPLIAAYSCRVVKISWYCASMGKNHSGRKQLWLVRCLGRNSNAASVAMLGCTLLVLIMKSGTRLTGPVVP